MNDILIFPKKSYNEAYPGRFWIDQDEAEPLIRALIDVYELPMNILKMPIAVSGIPIPVVPRVRERALVETLKALFRDEELLEENRKDCFYDAVQVALSGPRLACRTNLSMNLRDIVEAVEEDEHGASGA